MGRAVLVVGFVLLAGCANLGQPQEATTPLAQSSVNDTSTPALVEVAGITNLAIPLRLVEHTIFEDETGRVFIVGIVKNADGPRVGALQGTVTMRDEIGDHSVAIDARWSHASVRSQATTPFRAEWAFHTGEYALVKIHITGNPVSAGQYETNGKATFSELAWNSTRIEGKIRNDDGEAHAFSIVATLRDEAGKLAGVETGTANPRTVPAYGFAPLRIEVGPTAGKLATFELTIRAID